jgi:hypothetical protein
MGISWRADLKRSWPMNACVVDQLSLEDKNELVALMEVTWDSSTREVPKQCCGRALAVFSGIVEFVNLHT